MEASAQVTSRTPNVEHKYERFIGVYKMKAASFDEVVITQENGKLYAQASGEQHVEIYPESDNTFLAPTFNAKITFKNQSGTIVARITILLGGAMLEGEKIK
jgi:serine-type D-Ala-D-Ala carboxypeptidase/endopeptidase